eukprot:Seg1367.4 transcript_id=Seg1367.4/GoldUCD/mRNA.D3Y31 product="Ankyrin repeat domain-containing protein 11" protein_id=Seg1367.4/GoldUCD/D3Y31
MPLTERQQMALLLEMTAKEFQEQEDSKEKGKKSGESSSSKRSGTSSKRDSQKINKRNKRGETQLHLASIKGDIDRVKGLIKKGADVNMTDHAGWTPLHEACNRGHYRIVKILLKSGANVNAKGLEDDTPLHDASSNGHIKIVKILLKYRADPNRKNEDLENPLDVAESSEVATILEEYCALTETERENYSFSDDSAPESTSDDERSSIRSSEADQNKFESHPEDRVDDDNNNDKDDEISFSQRKHKLVSSRVISSHQKRICSDDDDDESDDDMELSRISEMVKRKKLAAAEKSEKEKNTALESHSTASDSQSVKEELFGNKVDTDQNLPSIATINEESLIKLEVKSDDHTEVDSADEISKKFKRKRKASPKPKEKIVQKNEDIFDDDDKSVDERSKKLRRKRVASEKTKETTFSRNNDIDDVVDKSVDESSKKLRRKRVASEKTKEPTFSRNDYTDDNDDKSVDENSKKLKMKRKTSEKLKEKMVPKSEDICGGDEKSFDERSKKFRRKRVTSEKTKEATFSRNDDIDDVDDESADEISKKFMRKRKTSVRTNEQTFSKSEDNEHHGKSVGRPRKKLKKRDDLVESTPIPKRAYRKKKAEGTRSDDDDDDDDGDERLNDTKDNERNKSASKLQRKSSFSDSSLSKPDKIELAEKNDKIFDSIMSPEDNSPTREFCTKSFDNNPYISDISDAEFDEGVVHANEGRITSDMFRANIFTNVLEKLSDQSPATDQHSLSEPQSDVVFSDQATDSESLKNVDKDGMKRDVNKEEWPGKSLKEKEMSLSKRSAPPKDIGVDVLLEAQSASSTGVVKLEDKKTKSEKKHRRRRLSSWDCAEDKEIDSVKVDKRKDYEQDVFAEVKTRKLKEDEKTAKRSKKRRRSETEEGSKKRRKSESSSKELFLQESGDKSTEERFDYEGKMSYDKRVTAKEEVKHEMDDGEVASAAMGKGSEKKSVRSRLDTSKESMSYKKKEATKSAKSHKEGKKYHHEQEVALGKKKKKASSTKSKIALLGMTSSSDTSDSEAFLDVVRLPVEKNKKSKLNPDLKEKSLKSSAEVDRDSKGESDSHKVRKIRHDSSSKAPKDEKTKESKKHRAKDSKPGKSDSDASLHPNKSIAKDSEDSKALEVKPNESKKTNEKEKYGDSEGKIWKVDTSSSKSEKHKKLSPVKDPRESKVSTKETKDSKALLKRSMEDKGLGTNSKSSPKEKRISSKEMIGSISSSKESRESKSPHKKSIESKIPMKEAEQTKSSSKEVKELKILTKEARISSKGTSEANSLSKESVESKSPFKKSHDSKTSAKESEKSKTSYKESKELKTFLQETKISSKDTTESNKSSKESKSPLKKSHDSKTSAKESEKSKASYKESKELKTFPQETKISSKDTTESNKSSKESKSPLKKSHDSKTSAKESENSKASYKESKELKTFLHETKISSKDTTESNKSSKESKESKSPSKKSHESKTFPKESEQSKSSSRESKDIKISSKEPKESKLAAKQSKESKISLSKDHKDSKATTLKDSKIASKESKITPIKAKRESKDVDLKIWDFGLQLTPITKVSKSGKSQMKSKESKKIRSSESRNKKDRDSKFLDQRLEPKSLAKEKPRVLPSLDVCLPSAVGGVESSDSLSLSKKVEKKSTKPVDDKMDMIVPDLAKGGDSLKVVKVSLSGGSPPKITSPLPSPEGRKQILDEPTCIVDDLKPDENVTNLPAEEGETLEASRKHPFDVLGIQDEAPGGALKDTETPEKDVKLVSENIKPCIEDLKSANKDQRIYLEGAEREKDNERAFEEDSKKSVQPHVKDMEPIPGNNSELHEPCKSSEEALGAAVDDMGPVTDGKVMKRRLLSDSDNLNETKGSIDGTASVTGDQVIKRHSLSDTEDLAETKRPTDDAAASVTGDQVMKRHSLLDIEDLAETKGSIDDTGSVIGDQAIQRHSLSDTEGLAETKRSTDNAAASVNGDQVMKRHSLSDIEDLDEAKGSIDDTASVIDDRVRKRHSLSDTEDLDEAKRPTDDAAASVTGDHVMKRHSLLDIEDLDEAKGATGDTGSVIGNQVIQRHSLSDTEDLDEAKRPTDDAAASATGDHVMKRHSLLDIEDLDEAKGATGDTASVIGDQIIKRHSQSDIEDLDETKRSIDDTASVIDDQVIKRHSLSDIEDLDEIKRSIDDAAASVIGDQVMKRPSLSDIEDLDDTKGSIDDTASVIDDRVIKRHSLLDIEDLDETKGAIEDTASVTGDQVIKRSSDTESLAETRESMDEAMPVGGDQDVKRRSLPDIEDLAEKNGCTDAAKSAAGNLVLKHRSVSDIKDLAETRESKDDTQSVAGDQIVKHGSRAEMEGLAETRESIDDTRSVAGDQVLKRHSPSSMEDVSETRGLVDDTRSVAGDQVVKRRSISAIENLAETALVASDAVSMDSPRSPHKKSDTSSTNLESVTSWPESEETRITTSTDEEVKKESICDDDKTEVPLREMPLLEKEVVDNEQDSKAVAPPQKVDKTAAESVEEKDRSEVDGSEIDESKVAESKVSEPHEDGISDLGAVSDLEEHLGPFHGTKLEETDIDIKELSHPEETLKILTQEIRNSHAAREEHKDTEHGFSSVKMTGHDFSMLSEEINDKVQRLCSRSFVSELSEEDRHIVNISMEIAENLSQDRDENVDNTLDGIEELDKDVTCSSTHETLDRSVTEFNKDSKEISGTSSPVTQPGKNTGSPVDENNDTRLSAMNLSTNTDKENKGMVSDKLIAVSGPADIKTSITGSRLDFDELSSATTTTSERKTSRTVDTGSPVTSQATNAVCKPIYTRSRTVDLEPRGIAQVVADIDLNSISHCIMDNSGTAREPPPASDNITDPEATKEIENIDDESLTRRPEETEATHEVSRDSLKKSISPTLPSTWRKALLKDHMKLSQALPEAYEKFAVVKGNYLLADAQSVGERPEDDDSQLEELNQEHLIELERLHLCMEQELIRVERRYRLACSKKKSISACSAIMYQKLEQYAKLSRHNHSSSQPTMNEAEAEEMRKTWIKEVLDKFKRKEEEMLKRHSQELSCLEQRLSFNKMHSLGRKEILRKRYLTAQSKISGRLEIEWYITLSKNVRDCYGVICPLAANARS